MNASFRSRLKHGEILIGTMITLPSPEIAEILADAGFDWLFVDLEHTPMAPYDAQAILQAVANRADCILRVPLNDEIWIKKALDTGAAGVMVPLVNSVKDAQRAVRYCKYPPMGSRSVGISRAHGYGSKLQDYLEKANLETSLIAQIEHIDAVKNIKEIISIEGIDALLVGPYDLSASMGHMGQVDHPEVQAAISSVRQACQKAGMPLGIFAAMVERAKIYLDEGYRLIAVGSDTMMLVETARQTFHAFDK